LELIFLTYINRSGSTFLAQIMSRSDEILVCPEAEVLVEKFLEAPEKKFVLTDISKKNLIQCLNEDWKFKHWGISSEDLESLPVVSNNFKAFCSILNIYREKIKPTASKILFKAERIIYLWNRLEKVFQGDNKLYLIAIIRDPRGIYASQKNTSWPGSDRPFSYNPVHTSILWRRYIREVQRLMKFNSNIKQIKYEDLLKNPAGSLEYLTQKIRLKKISFIPGNGDYYDRIPEDQKLIHGNIKLHPIREKENEWKRILNKLEIDLIQSITNKCMNKVGYIPEIRNVSLFRLLQIIIPQIMIYYFHFYSNKIFFRINKMINGKGSL
jgi:hypothetical protein